MRAIVWLALSAVMLALSACGYSRPLESAAAKPAGPYRLASGEQVRITIFNQSNLSGEFPIDGAGYIAFPLVGLIEAGNKTPNELAKLLADELTQRGYLVNPSIAVQVTQFRPYYILGEVGAPGSYPYSLDMTGMKAVAAARGFTYRANTKRVYVQRAGESEEHLYELTPAMTVQPGDTIRIPERFF